MRNWNDGKFGILEWLADDQGSFRELHHSIIPTFRIPLPEGISKVGLPD